MLRLLALALLCCFDAVHGRDVELPNIPKIVFQTYHKKHTIPAKVYKNIARFADGYKHVLYDDEECIAFLKQHYGDHAANAFTYLHGPHKADLVRYAWLYLYGGVYIDIKTELVLPLDKLLVENGTLYTVLSYFEGTIYDGFIATPPHNPVFSYLIHFCIQIANEIHTLGLEGDDKKYYKQYHRDQRQFQELIGQDLRIQVTSDMNSKLLTTANGLRAYYLYQERVDRDPSGCYDGIDRWGWCAWIFNGSKKVIKVRYADFPWDEPPATPAVAEEEEEKKPKKRKSKNVKKSKKSKGKKKTRSEL